MPRAVGLRSLALCLVAVAAASGCGAGAAPPGTSEGPRLRVSGSTTVNPVAADAAEALRREGLEVTVDSQGGSAGGIAQLGAGRVEIAMSSKGVSDEDRRRFPGVDLVATEIGQDAVGIVVRREVRDGGVASLSREQLAALFEGRVGNWRQLGGPDLAVFVYDKEPGRGTREVLDAFLYGKASKAPPPPRSDNYAVVGGNEEARTKLVSTPGSVGPLSVSFASQAARLAVVAVEGIEPTPANVTSGSYPMARPLHLVTNGPPRGPAKRFVDYVLSPPGQELVSRHGFLPLERLRRR